MKLKFDSKLEYQLDAINAVVDLFEGLPPKQSGFEVTMSPTQGEFGVGYAPQQGEMQFNELGIGNRLILDDEQLLTNLHTIQERNNVEKSEKLIDYAYGDGGYAFSNFSVEMETGTGKTYVYLRSLFELNRKYGYKKFIIVVPSVAIREGVLSSIELMREHFRGLYDNVPFDHFVYNSKDLSKVRQFAVSNEIQIMIINIQAFLKKETNIIHQEQDKMSGRKPLEYIRATSPVLIIDEPQSVDNTPKAKKAIKTLKPMFCLRYSATHREPYNILYNLDPIKAYDMRLVKQIEVASVYSDKNINDTFIRLDSIGYAKNAKTPHAKATIYEDAPNGTKEKKVTLKQGTDLSGQTNRTGYDGYIVSNISAESGMEYVEFSNGTVLEVKQEQGGMGDEILKNQVQQTVEEHFKKEKKFQKDGIKVLSLFFIDKVSNYRYYDDDGSPQKGKIALWFEEAYRDISQKDFFNNVLKFSAEEVHDGYFSVDKKGGRVVALKDTSGSTKADDETYELIMRDKERLLSMDEPLRFIFTHSALKEGWDNPNVFQVCSLREMGTEQQRRQTLGRGLRLPVNSDGVRVYDDNINRLTVVASEKFEQYAKSLQDEIENDVGGGFKFGRIEKVVFSELIDPAVEQPLGQEKSVQVWTSLVANGYLSDEGDITEKFVPEEKGFKLEVSEEFEHIRSAVTDKIKRYIFRNRIVNARERRSVKYNKRIELNTDFKVLWDKIGKKTRYSVEFETEKLVKKAAKKIEGMPEIKPVRIFIDKTEAAITEAGVEGVREIVNKANVMENRQYLPDVLAFLQRETELTRKTLFAILKKSKRLKEFAVNPQAFMTEAAKYINRALHEMVVDGIKYEKIDGQAYEMRLFEEAEIEEYLSRLYEVKSKDDRTPYDYIVWESEVEREIAEKLDTNGDVKFFCKLPRWFVVPTPIGDYNPDWAIVTESDQKLYLVRETKSTHDPDKRRETENNKIKCGKAHFDVLGVDFKVATNVYEVIS